MKIELIGALDYAKLKELLKGNVTNPEAIIATVQELEKEHRANIVSTAGRLSRFSGNIFEVLKLSEEKDYQTNLNYIKRVTNMGHNSITDHDYLVFAIKDVTPVIEQTIIEERLCSFTIKSRREVDFSTCGFYTPDFHDENGKLLPNNDAIKLEYQEYMKSLFHKYSEFIDQGVTLEDARFILPYCYHSNIIMGIDAHVLKDMIIKYTKTKYAKITELREFGKKLLNIAITEVPYLLDDIANVPEKEHDEVDTYLRDFVTTKNYEILPKPEILHHTPNIDDTILKLALMRRYQYNESEATRILTEIKTNHPEFASVLMHKIAHSSDGLELTGVNFEFQVPLSFAVLTHLTRHRTHQILVPDFVPIVDLSQYKIPPKVKNICLSDFQEAFTNNVAVYNHFKDDYHIRPEDLIYFTLSGNMVNVTTNMDGKTLKHILSLRECAKAQWEIREAASGLHEEVSKLDDAKIFNTILGPSCVTLGVCKEGKETCGRLKTLERSKK